MMLNVEIISRQTIKPSSPTPPHLKKLKLSLLDQYNYHYPVYVILFYAVNGKYNAIDDLKRSLSQTLTYLYPLAGRFNDNNEVIDCNDEGVNFVQTRVKAPALLNHLLKNPLREELEQLLPTDNFFGQATTKVLLSVQANTFDCGGMALGVCFSHKLCDGSSLTSFLSIWSEVSRGKKVTIRPTFNNSTLFPPKFIPWVPQQEVPLGWKKFSTKRFVLDSLNVASLKARCSNKLYVERPTRVEVVSALIWRCVMNQRPKPMPKPLSVMNFGIDLRPRMIPHLSKTSFGNLAINITLESSAERQADLQSLVGQLRKGIRKVDDGYARQFDIASWLSDTIDYFKEDGNIETYTMISSWCKFPFYELDFGWGKPTWACPVMVTRMNMVILMDTKCGEGVEAWVTLPEEDMARFEGEPDIIAFTTTN